MRLWQIPLRGGFAATGLASVTGCAVHTILEAGVPYATIDLNVKFMKQIPKDTDLWSEATVLNMTRRLGAAEGSIRDNEGTVYVHARSSGMIKRQSF